jgi:two-component system chemotaxis response regulator CheY
MAKESCNILYIEDDLDNQMLLSFYTKNEGIHLEAVNNGKKALQALNGETIYDLLIIDWNLPGEPSGSHLLNKIRELPGYKSTPILILTAHSNRSQLANLDDEQISGCLFKPIKKQDLLENITKTCSKQPVT